MRSAARVARLGVSAQLGGLTFLRFTIGSGWLSEFGLGFDRII